MSALLALALCLPISISSCALWPKPAPPAAIPLPVVCPSDIMTASCPAPIYVFGDGPIAADVAAAVAIAESRARDACARQLDELQGCVRKHNGKARAGRRP